MKIPHKSKEKKDKIKRKEKLKPKKDQVLFVAQEIKFARLLSGNEKKSRDKVLKALKKWLLNCFEKKYEFKEDDFVRMWKGLFYAVWMSDKPLIQEELCESISGVLDLFPPEQLKYALLMFKAGLRVLATEWYGIDYHRMDKFLMLVRRYLRASLRCLLRSDWSQSSCQMYANMMMGSDGIFSVKTPWYARNATSMVLHIFDCYLEEIAKVSGGEIPGESLAELVRPLCEYMCSGASPTLCSAARRVLTALLRQSEPGLKYQHATQAWQQMGCPEGGPDALELVSDDDDEQNGEDDGNDDGSDKPLDPRAGRVDVELPLLPVPAATLADMLRASLAGANSKAYKRVKLCLERFEQLARNEYPLKIKTHEEEEESPAVPKPKQVAKSLQQLEKKLIVSSDELALRGLSRKHRKRLLAKSRSGLSIVEDVDVVRQNINNATNDGWQVETTEPEPKKAKQDTSNKENNKRKSNSKDAVLEKRRKVQRNIKKIKEKISSNVRSKIDNLDKHNKKHNKDSNTRDEVIKTKENGVTKDNSSKKYVDTNKHKENNKKNHVTLDKTVSTPKLEKPSVKNDKTPKSDKRLKSDKSPKSITPKSSKSPTVLVNKVKNYQKQSSKSDVSPNKSFDTPKKVKFVLKNNSMQAPVDYYKSIRQSPNIPFDGTKKPSKTNLKPSTPSPINPFFKKKLKLKH